MWWVGCNSRGGADAYLGTRRVLLRRGADVLLDAAIDAWQDGLARLQQAVGEQPRRLQVRLFLSGGLCRPFLLPDVDGAETDRDWRLIARSMASEATGAVEPCDVWLEGRRPGPRLAIAMESATQEQLLGSLEPRLKSMRPWWCAALEHRVKKDANCTAIAVHDCDSLTVLFSESSNSQSWIHVHRAAAREVDPQPMLNRLRISVDWAGDDIPLVRLAEGVESQQVSPGTRAPQLVFAEALA